MTIVQPDWLMVQKDPSGAVMTNNGAQGGTYSVAQGTENTHWFRRLTGGPYGSNGYFESTVAGTGASNKPYMTTAHTPPANALATISYALAFWVDTFSNGAAYLLSGQGGDGDAQVWLSNLSGSTFDVNARWINSGSGVSPTTVVKTGASTGAWNLILGTVDVTTATACQARYKFNSDAVQSPATFNFSGFTFRANWPGFLVRADLPNYYGLDGRLPLIAYWRGGTALSSAEMDSLAADPTIMPGWPSAAALTMGSRTSDPMAQPMIRGPM